VLTTSRSGSALENGLVFCWIDSWMTGKRMVSLPFSDHCDLLSGDESEPVDFLPTLDRLLRRENMQYVELRPSLPAGWASHAKHTGFQTVGYSYCIHYLDLRSDLATLFGNFHKDSTQRKIRRAEREKLKYEEGRSAAFIDAFYALMLLTRRRHGLPPQPKKWFVHLAECFGDALKIRIATKDDRPVAAILTLRHKQTVVYKYGCSDARYNNLGGTHLLFWKTIEEAKREGALTLDLGRSEFVNDGLITFKDRWGSTRSTLEYIRLTTGRVSRARFSPPGGDWKENVSKRLLSIMPDTVLCTVGDLLYKHIG
jgi:hypothetical protein